MAAAAIFISPHGPMDMITVLVPKDFLRIFTVSWFPGGAIPARLRVRRIDDKAEAASGAPYGTST
jgi:hypothetical protein